MVIIPNVSSDGPDPVRKRCMRAAGWTFLLLLSVFIYGSHAPLIALSKVDGQVPFSSSSFVLLVELLKLLLSLGALAWQGWPSTHSQSSCWWWVGEAVPYGFPALLYALNNNLVVEAQAHMDPSSFQVLSNLKIVSTALLYCCCSGTRLRRKQWAALCLLTTAGVCHSYSTLDPQEEGQSQTRLHVSMWGLLLVLIYCLASGTAAVYTERTLKSQRLPLSLQNIFLYVFGVAANGAAHLASKTDGQGFLKGFSPLVWAIVVGQVANGLLMSLVMKRSGSITRLFIISCSLLVNGALSWALLGLQLTPLFALEVAMVGLAIHLY